MVQVERICWQTASLQDALNSSMHSGLSPCTTHQTQELEEICTVLLHEYHMHVDIARPCIFEAAHTLSWSLTQESNLDQPWLQGLIYDDVIPIQLKAMAIIDHDILASLQAPAMDYSII